LSKVVRLSASPRIRLAEGEQASAIASSSGSDEDGRPRTSRTARAVSSSPLAFQSTSFETRPSSDLVELGDERGAASGFGQLGPRLEAAELGRRLEPGSARRGASRTAGSTRSSSSTIRPTTSFCSNGASYCRQIRQ
jgi:hypothetical protein